ncbi:MAG: hypothetical protein N4A47_03710 [Clostridia bacterium]|jgi:DNA-binding transcriptional MerR regulator|nr:hypothetical protein [Clostridia bacterium]
MAFNIFSSNTTEQLKKAKEEIAVLQERVKVKDRQIAQLNHENIKLCLTTVDKEDIEKYKELLQKNQEEYNDLLVRYNKLLREYRTLKNTVQKPVVRPSRKTEKNLELIKEFKARGMSYSQIAKAMEEVTGENWAKSTIHMFLNK